MARTLADRASHHRPAGRGEETGAASVDSVRVASTGLGERRSAPDEGVANGFRGCRPVHIPRDTIAHYEGRFEYWDADTEIAWTAREPTSVYHELPGQRLARLTERIAAVRGAPIESYGSGDLLVRDGAGARHRIMQADQVLYLHPGEARPLGHSIEVGHDDLPDVVLEVDLTTDVRPRKMGLYREWGFWGTVGRGPAKPGPESTEPQTGTYQSHPVTCRLRGGTGEPGVSHLDGIRDPRCPQRVRPFHVDRCRAAAGGAATRRAGRYGHR